MTRPLYRTPEVLVERRFGVAGHFNVQRLVPRTEVVLAETGWFQNTITNGGLDLIGTSTLEQIFAHLAVGTANVPPAPGDLSLGNEVARTNNNGGFTDSYGVDAVGGYAWRQMSRVFTEGQANDVVLAELGFFNAVAGGTLGNRQLIRDNTGAPTTISKKPVEWLRVLFELRLYFPAQQTRQKAIPGVNGGDPIDVTFGVRTTDSAWGTTLTRTFGGAFAAASSAAAHESNALPPSTASGVAVTPVAQAYVPGSHYRDALATWGSTQANFATGIGSLQYGLTSAQRFWWMAFSSRKITEKVSGKQFAVVLRNSWARR